MREKIEIAATCAEDEADSEKIEEEAFVVEDEELDEVILVISSIDWLDIIEVVLFWLVLVLSLNIWITKTSVIVILLTASWSEIIMLISKEKFVSLLMFPILNIKNSDIDDEREDGVMMTELEGNLKFIGWVLGLFDVQGNIPIKLDSLSAIDNGHIICKGSRPNGIILIFISYSTINGTW